MRTLDEAIAKEKESADRCKKIFEEFEKNRQSSYDCGYEVGYNKAIDDFVAKYKFCDNMHIQCRKAMNCADCIAEQLKAGV